MKTNFETIANAKIKVEYFERTANGDLIQTKVSNWKTVAEEIFTKQGIYTLKTIIYERENVNQI